MNGLRLTESVLYYATISCKEKKETPNCIKEFVKQLFKKRFANQ